MRLFFTETHIINLDNVTSVNTDRSVVTMINGNEFPLTDRENRDIRDVMKEFFHRQWCEQKRP